MGKSWRENPSKWKHKIKHNKPGKFKGGKPRHDDNGNGDKKYSPFDDSQGYHSSVNF